MPDAAQPTPAASDKTEPHAKMTRLRALSRPRTTAEVSHTVRTRDGGVKTLKYGRKLAIRLACTECLGWEDHPKDCTSPLCPLFPFRGITLLSQRRAANQPTPT
jgi:hypothetical protein